MPQTLREIINTPASRAKAKAMQDELRERLGPSLVRRPAELRYAYGVDRVEMATQLLDQLTPEHRNFEAYQQWLMNTMAEGLSMQGRFREAALLTQSAPHAGEYLAKANALEALGPTCDCPAEVVWPSATDAKGRRTPARVTIQSVFDGKNRFALIRCEHCKRTIATLE